MSAASQALADNPILRPASVQCRSLTVAGRQCKSTAMRGQDLCVQHAKCRHPVLQRGPNVTIPLMEDLESVQVFVTQVMQGILAESIDPIRAGKLLYACQIAANTMPRPARLKPTKAQESPAEPVTEIFESPDGQPLGPIVDTRKTALFSDFWSFHKFRYEEECERLGRPLPQTPADMPQAGWLTSDDLRSLNEQVEVRGSFGLDDGYLDKMLELRLDADRRGKLPPLAERECMYGNENSCHGPGSRGPWQNACTRCARERDEYRRLHPELDAPAQPKDLHARAEPSGAPQLSDAAGCPTLIAPPLRDRVGPTPHVKSVNIANSRRSNHLLTHPHQGGTPFSENTLSFLHAHHRRRRPPHRSIVSRRRGDDFVGRACAEGPRKPDGVRADEQIR